MRKIILKLVFVCALGFGLGFLPGDSKFSFILLIGLNIMAVALLIVIIIALFPLVKESMAAQKLRSYFRKPGEGYRIPRYSAYRYNDLEVSYLWSLNGGGIIFAYEFVYFVSKNIGKVDHVFEYCAGPGFIGFSLLAHNLCEKLTLADVNPEAVAAVKETVKNNNLEGKVTVYQSDCLDAIPESEQWDLVVANPPWSLHSKYCTDIKLHDKGGMVHSKFYRDIKKYLKKNGSVLFIEGGEYTRPRDFKDYIGRNGLELIGIYKPVKLFDKLRNMDGFKGFRIPLVIVLHLSLFIREAYFVWSTMAGAPFREKRKV